MEKFKKFLNAIKYPKGKTLVVTYFVAILFISASIILACFGKGTSIPTYIIYACAAISLGYVVYTFCKFPYKKIKEKIITAASKYDFTYNLIKNYGYRTVIFASCSFTFNTLYAMFHAIVAIISTSIWYGALAVYYIFLCVLRGGVILSNHKTKKKKEDTFLYNHKRLITYRTCGIILIIMTIMFSAAIVQMVIYNNGFEHAGLMIYVFAAYTFYKIIISIYNVIKARKQDNFLVQALRNINFADALISILALQTAMFKEFAPSDYNTSVFNIATGTGVSVLIITLGIIMIVKANINLKINKKEQITNLEEPNEQ